MTEQGWAVAYRLRTSGEWALLGFTYSRTRAGAIREWKEMWGGSEAWKARGWRRKRDRGEVKSVRVKLEAL